MSAASAAPSWGVLAEGFYFPGPREEVWTPYVMRPDEPTAVVLGRLRPGVSAAQGNHRGPRHPAAHGRRRAVERGRERPHFRGCRADPRPHDPAAGRDGRRVSSGPGRAGVGHCAHPADRLRQRGRVAAGAGRDPPARVGGLRGAGRRTGADRAPATDREHAAEPGRRRAGRRGPRPPCFGWCRRWCRATSCGSTRVNVDGPGARVHARVVGGGRDGVRRTRPAVVRESTAPHPDGGRRMVRGAVSGYSPPIERGQWRRWPKWRWRWCCSWGRSLLLRSFVGLVTVDRAVTTRPTWSLPARVVQPLSSSNGRTRRT